MPRNQTTTAAAQPAEESPAVRRLRSQHELAVAHGRHDKAVAVERLLAEQYDVTVTTPSVDELAQRARQATVARRGRDEGPGLASRADTPAAASTS